VVRWESIPLGPIRRDSLFDDAGLEDLDVVGAEDVVELGEVAPGAEVVMRASSFGGPARGGEDVR